MKFASLFIQAAKSNPSAKVAGMVFEARRNYRSDLEAIASKLIRVLGIA